MRRRGMESSAGCGHVDWLKSHGMEARAPSSNSVPPWEPYSIDIFKFHPHALSSDLFHVVMFF